MEIVVRIREQEEEGVALLFLSCGHYTTVPLDDERALSFKGAELECSACAKGSQ